MDEAELVGGVLVDAADPREAARRLADLLLASHLDRTAAARAGLHPDLVDVIRARIGNHRERVWSACQEGAAWVLGRRSGCRRRAMGPRRIASERNCVAVGAPTYDR